MTFAELGLSPALLKALAEQNYTSPTPIQTQAIPVILSGRDVMAAAQTGTGKTAGFTLPLLQLLSESQRTLEPTNVRTLILTPTRELAAQVAESVDTYGHYLNLKQAVIFGGVSLKPQIEHLKRGVDVLVATPGRLLDLYNQKAVKFTQLEYLVLDEADRMLDMGFIHDIRKVLSLLPKQRQTLLFSATFSDEIRTLAQKLLKQPVSVEVAARNTTATTVTQSLFEIDKTQKPALLSHLVRANEWQQVLVFTRTKHGANRLAEKLGKDGITSAAIHGNKSQNARTKALADFKQGTIRVLVATDIAARGLDIEQLPQVVNFELPNVAEDYVHRIGRTGRAGAEGHAISLVEHEELKLLVAIERLTKQTIKREAVPVITVSTLKPIHVPRDPPDPRRVKQQAAKAQPQAARPKKAANQSAQTPNKAPQTKQQPKPKPAGAQPPAKVVKAQFPKTQAHDQPAKNDTAKPVKYSQRRVAV